MSTYNACCAARLRVVTSRIGRCAHVSVRSPAAAAAAAAAATPHWLRRPTNGIGEASAAAAGGGMRPLPCLAAVALARGPLPASGSDVDVNPPTLTD